MKILDLGAGYAPVPNAFRVDVNKNYDPDLVFDLNDAWGKLRSNLPAEWDEIYCKNVINYLDSLENVENLFSEVSFLLKPNGVFHLEFMNIANKEGLRLHYLTVRRLLIKTGFNCRLETKRHWIVPTGNVKVTAWKVGLALQLLEVM